MGSKSNRFVVYAYVREEDDYYAPKGTYYYIGKGIPRRPYDCSRRKIKCPKNKQKNIHILCKNLEEKTAYSVEKYLISFYGRVGTDLGGGILLNKTEGGEGARGTQYSEERKKAVSLRMKGKNHPNFGKRLSKETRDKISKSCSGSNHWMYGKQHSEETKNKIRQSKLGKNNPMFGRVMPEEQKEKLRERMTGKRNHMFGKVMPEETRKKISEAQKGEKSHMFGKHLSEKTKRKISEAQRGEKGNMYGKRHSPETRAKMSEAQRGEKNHNFGKHLDEEVKEKIRKKLLQNDNPSRIPRDWEHPTFGVVKQTPICDLIKMYPDQELKSYGLSNVANLKAKHHKGWRCTNSESEPF